MAGAAADAHEAVDDVLRDALDDLALLDAGEGFPEIEEAVQGGAAFDGYTAGVAFVLEEDSGGALSRGRDGGHDTCGAAAGDDDVEAADGEAFGGLFMEIGVLRPSGRGCRGQADG